MDLPKAHRSAGLGALVVFLLTGVYMKLRFPGLYSAAPELRYMYRANHVYILLAALVNLAFGLSSDPKEGSKDALPAAGSALLLSSPVVLLAAFLHDPPTLSRDRFVTTAGIVLLAAGTACRVWDYYRRPKDHA